MEICLNVLKHCFYGCIISKCIMIPLANFTYCEIFDFVKSLIYDNEDKITTLEQDKVFISSCHMPFSFMFILV